VTIFDQLGPDGAMFAQLVEAREQWTVEELALELRVSGFAREKEQFETWRAGVMRDLSVFGAKKTEARNEAQLLHEAIALRRVQDALPLLEQVTWATVMREYAKLAAHEADRQDAAGRRGGAERAEAEALRAADVAAAEDENSA
jgi:hypothetical protein